MANRCGLLRRSSLLIVLMSCLSLTSVHAQTGDEALVFDLEEAPTSTFDGYRGFECGSQPDPNIQYPSFQSACPLFGSVCMDQKMDEPSLYAFVLDESGGTGAGYDRLIIDLDHDCNLIHEPFLNTLKKSPFEGRDYGWTNDTYFQFVTLSRAAGDDGEFYSMEFAPRFFPRLLPPDLDSSRTLELIPTSFRKARIEIAGQPVDVFMVNSDPMGTRWDRPWTQLSLSNVFSYGWCGDRLFALRCVGGRDWRFSTTPQGDKLIAEPYTGGYGQFKLESGGRLIFDLKMEGTLSNKELAVPICNINKGSQNSYHVPVGDYRITNLSLDYGSMHMDLLPYPHASKELYEPQGGTLQYGLNISKDKPCVLDFSNPPEIRFVSPRMETCVHPGKTIEVQALLVDPQLGFKFGDLRIHPPYEIAWSKVVGIAFIMLFPILIWSRIQRKRRYWYVPTLFGIALVGFLAGAIWLNLHLAAEVKVQSFTKLEPTVEILRSDGEIVATGIMPFG